MNHTTTVDFATSELRSFATKLMEAAERAHCYGLISDEDVNDTDTLTGVTLAAHILGLADLAEKIDQDYVQNTVAHVDKASTWADKARAKVREYPPLREATLEELDLQTALWHEVRLSFRTTGLYSSGEEFREVMRWSPGIAA